MTPKRLGVSPFANLAVLVACGGSSATATPVPVPTSQPPTTSFAQWQEAQEHSQAGEDLCDGKKFAETISEYG